LYLYRLGQVTGDAGDHLGQLDRAGDVVDEVDEDGQVGHHQRERDGDADVGHEVAVWPGADRDQHQDRIDERRDEGAKRQLGPPVADEVPQHAGPELGGRQCQGDQDDREHDTHDRDDRRRDRGQDLPGRVGGAADHPGRHGEGVVIGGPVDGGGGREQRDGRDDFNRWDQPQVRPQDFALPVRTQCRRPKTPVHGEPLT